MKQIYKQLFVPLGVALLLFFSTATLHSQTLRFLDVPTGKEIVRQQARGGGGGDTYAPGEILLGAVPGGSGQKPVLVFIHGYNSDADTWFVENDMYDKAYQAGYRTAFVSVHHDKGMWANGELFSQQLQTICGHFGVQKVVVVAHSKGGIDADAALLHYGGTAKVNRVITLGSPHYGTPLADLAQSNWVWWLSAIFGQRNEATYVLQTGYMDYYRSVTDGRAENGATDFRTIGGWKYSGSLLFSGWYLNANGGSSSEGGNDGVVPYKSSRRPFGTELFSGHGDANTAFNHSEIAQGSSSWGHVASQLPSSLARTQLRMAQYEGVENPNAVVRSYSIILSAEAGESHFPVEEGVQAVKLDVRQQAAEDKVELKGLRLDPARIQQQAVRKVKDGMVGKFATQVHLQKPAAGQYTLTSETPYIAIITAEGGGYAELHTDLNAQKRVYRLGEQIHFALRLMDAQEQPVSGAQIEGSLRLTTNLKGEAAGGDGQPVSLEFVAGSEAGVYEAVSAPLRQSGIYNISIDARTTHFARSLVHSVAAVEPPYRQKSSVENPFAVSAYPNPFREQLTIGFVLEEKSEVSLQISDMLGRKVFAQPVQAFEQGVHRLQWNGKSSAGGTLSAGSYIYELTIGGQKQQGRLLLQD